MPFNAAVAIPRFEGLANNLDQAQQSFETLRHATNFILNNNGWPHIRNGYTSLVSDVQALHINRYGSAGYYIKGNALYALDTQTELLPDVGNEPFYFTDAGSRTYFNSSSGSYYVDNSRVFEWGLLVPAYPDVMQTSGGKLYAGKYRIAFARSDLKTGAVSGTLAPLEFDVIDGAKFIIQNLPQEAGYANVILVSKTDGSIMYEYARTTQVSIEIDEIDAHVGRVFPYINMYPPPLSGPICFHNGRIYVAVYDAQQNFTSIFGSERNAFSFFNLTGDSDYDELGQVNCLVSLPHGLLIGKDFEIVYMANDGERRVLAQYGTVPGNNFAYDESGLAYVVTQRGVRRAGGEPLFADLNEERFITDWGESCGSGYVRMQGVPLFITSVFNSNIYQPTKGFQDSPTEV